MLGYKCYKGKVIIFYLMIGLKFVKNVFVDGLEFFLEIGERFNKEIRVVKNWRNLVYRLEIFFEIYSLFDIFKEKVKSFIKMMFQWFVRWKFDLNIGDLFKSIKVIDRFDVAEIVIKEVEVGEFVFCKLNDI